MDDVERRTRRLITEFFSKVAQLVLQARIPGITHPAPGSPPRISKWFQTESIESESIIEAMREGWSRDFTAGALNSLPLVIDVLLAPPGRPGEGVVFGGRASDGKTYSATAPDQTSRAAILERWVISLQPPSSRPPPGIDVVYKRAVVLLRSLCSHLRVLPASKVFKRRRKNRLAAWGLWYTIDHHISVDNESQAEFEYAPVDTLLGRLVVSVSYRTEVRFQVVSADADSQLSSKFIEDHFSPQVPDDDSSDSGVVDIARDAAMEAGEQVPNKPRWSEDVFPLDGQTTPLLPPTPALVQGAPPLSTITPTTSPPASLPIAIASSPPLAGTLPREPSVSPYKGGQWVKQPSWQAMLGEGVVIPPSQGLATSPPNEPPFPSVTQNEDLIQALSSDMEKYKEFMEDAT